MLCGCITIIEGLSPKLQKPWQIPCVIVKRMISSTKFNLGPWSRPRVVHFNRLWKHQRGNRPCWLITTGSNPTESVASSGSSSNDKVQCDMGALDTPSPENEAIGNTTISGITAPAPSDGESTPQRSSRLRRRPEQYGNDHLGQATLKEGTVWQYKPCQTGLSTLGMTPDLPRAQLSVFNFSL